VDDETAKVLDRLTLQQVLDAPEAGFGEAAA
jgi:hypothetical protein